MSVSGPVEHIYGLEGIAEGEADGTCLNGGREGDDRDEEAAFVLYLDCRQWLSLEGALVCGSPISRESLPLSRSHLLDSSHFADELPSSMSPSGRPSMPSTQSISRYPISFRLDSHPHYTYNIVPMKLLHCTGP